MPSPNLQRDNYNNVIQKTYGERAFQGAYDGSNNLIYAGFALPGTATSEPSWQIRKLVYDMSNNLTEILWPEFPYAGGISSRDYKFVWDDHTSYTYS
jgi:hypothetical protein